DDFGSAVIFSADSTRLYSGGSGERIDVWDVGSGSVQKSFAKSGSGGGLYVMALSPDNSVFVAVGDGEEAPVWNARDGKFRGHVPVSGYNTFAVAVSPDSKEIAIGAPNGSVDLLDVNTKRRRLKIGGQGTLISAIAYLPATR